MFYNYQARLVAYNQANTIVDVIERQQALEAFVAEEREILNQFRPPRLPSLLLKQAQKTLHDMAEPRIVGDVANVARALVF